MTGAVRAAVEVALLGRAALAARGPRDRSGAGRERREEPVQTPDDVGLAADHEAVTAVEPPHAATRPAIDVVETRGAESLGALDIVAVVRVPPVDDDVTGREARHEPIERRVDDGRRHHEPDAPRLLEARDQVIE